MTNKRKPLSKKTRFDVFKRDGFRCQYCGSTPPAAVLEVDHITPVSRGGTNVPDNLITACFDCNRGKSDGELSSVPMSLAEKSALLEEKELQIREYNKLLRKVKKRETEQVNALEGVFQQYFTSREFTEPFRVSVRNNFLKQLDMDKIEYAMHKACAKCRNAGDALKYFCGICWSMIKSRHG